MIFGVCFVLYFIKFSAGKGFYSIRCIASLISACLIAWTYDDFYRISLWPKKMDRLFWEKPISNQETFQLLLFLVENGCPPDLSTQWILTSTYWDKTKTNPRFIQTGSILANVKKYCKTWFYFDLHLKKYVHLDGTDRLLHC